MGGIGGGAGFALYIPFVNTSEKDPVTSKEQFFNFTLWTAIIFTAIYVVALLIYSEKPEIPPTYKIKENGIGYLRVRVKDQKIVRA